jgi:predicted ester cyclase
MSTPPIDGPNGQAVIAFNAAANNHDLIAIRTFFVRGFRYHTEPANTNTLQNFISMLSRYYQAIPDAQGTMISSFASGDWMAVFYEHTGTFTGRAEGWPRPTGKKFLVQGAVRVLFNAAHKQVESWTYSDRLSMREQLGI